MASFCHAAEYDHPVFGKFFSIDINKTVISKAFSTADEALDLNEVSTRFLAVNADLKQTSYILPESNDIQLIEQIGLSGLKETPRLGRLIQPKDIFDSTCEIEHHATEQVDMFSENLRLGLPIKHYFDQIGRPHDGLFQYSMFGDPLHTKSIIINYYGGFRAAYNLYSRKCNLTQALGLNPLIDDGHTVIHFDTRDSWQTIIQSHQFKRPEGKELLTDTLISFLLFAREVKSTYPGTPVYYYGASFGAAKGALINLILSNLDNLEEMCTPNFKDVAEHLAVFIKRHLGIDKSLIDGFILHDGGYYYLYEDDGFVRKFNTQIPMLLLHNFDDERVKIDKFLKFYRRLKSDNADHRTISFYITPQSASSFIQPLEDFDKGSSSIHGHFKPTITKYRVEYYSRIFKFLENPTGFSDTSGIDQFHMAMNAKNYDHIATLWGEDSLLNLSEESVKNKSEMSFDEDKSPNERIALYRLYYANLHSEKKDKNITMAHRLQKTFSQYVAFISNPLMGQINGIYNDYLKPPSCIEKTYSELVQSHSVWLIHKILRKNQNTRKAIGTLWSKNKKELKKILKNKRQGYIIFDEIHTPIMPLAVSKSVCLSVSSADIISSSIDIPQPGDKYFYITEDGRRSLVQKENSLDIIKRAKKYSVILNERIIKFFHLHLSALTAEEIKKLWVIDNFQESQPLPFVSRTFSLIQKNDSNDLFEEKYELFNLLVQDQHSEFMFRLNNKELQTDDYISIQKLLLTQDADERLRLTSQLSRLLPSTKPIKELKWLILIPKEDRNMVLIAYLKIKTVLYYAGIRSCSSYFELILEYFQGINYSILKDIQLEQSVTDFMCDIWEMFTKPKSEWSSFIPKTFGPL